uniref:Complex 1 LYR protein domain-containing protein n=1 Tax=Parascaris univalens TaxID=6257 RepID=A0A915C9J9_PARUN
DGRSILFFLNAFWRNRNETDPEKIKTLIAKGDFIVKELETLYYLRKYRTLKQRYYQ